MSASATPPEANETLTKVEFYANGNLIGTDTASPYSFSWTDVAAGTYTLSAIATDAQGASTTSAVRTIVVNAPPTISLVADPAAAVAPASIVLTATANDADGMIAKVEFFQGATLIATINTPGPYTFTVNSLGAGIYSFTARATDNTGLTATSAAATVTVTVEPGAGAATIYYIYTDQLKTPRAITNEAATPVWKWDNVDPFGANAPDEDPDGDTNPFVFNLRFPGQYFDRETNTHYNYFRDYDPAIGRYIQSDPIGVIGQIRQNGEAARHHHFMAGRYDLATSDSHVADIRALSFMPERRVPETNLYSYVGSKPLSFTDPTGEIIREAAIAITATAIGITLYATYDCASKCPSVCPIPQTGDPQDSRDRDAWILNCKISCVKSFGGFLRKYGSPTPPIDLLIK